MSEPGQASGAVEETESSRAKRLGFSALLWQGSTLVSTLTSIVLALVIARLRGPDWYGNLTTYLFISGVGATIGAMGIPNTLAKYVSELKGSANTHAAILFSRRQIKAVTRSGLVAAFGVLAVMALLFLGKGYDDVPSLVVIALSVPITILFSSATQLSVGLQDFKSVLVATVVSKAFLVVVGLTVVLLNFPLFVYLSVLTTSTAIGAILQFRASRIFRSEKDTGILPVDIESRAKGYGRALWINSVLDLVVWQQSGVFFLWLFVGSSYAGQFSIAYTLTYVLIGLLSGSIVLSLFPEFSKLYGGGDAQRGHSTFRVGFKANTLLVAPVATFLVLGGSSLAAILFGAEFDQAGEVIFLLAISSGFVAIGGLATSFGYAQEKHFSWMKIALASSVLAIALFLVMVPLMGLLGAVIVQACVQVLGISIVLYVVAARMKLQIPWRHCCIAVGLAAASYLTAYFVLGLMFTGTIFLLIWGALGSVIYLLLVIALSAYDPDTSMILRTSKTMLKTIIGVS